MDGVPLALQAVLCVCRTRSCSQTYRTRKRLPVSCQSQRTWAQPRGPGRCLQGHGCVLPAQGLRVLLPHAASTAAAGAAAAVHAAHGACGGQQAKAQLVALPQTTQGKLITYSAQATATLSHQLAEAYVC
jgi:hypothetical protein